MILSQLLGDEPKRDEARLAQSILDVVRRAEGLGLDRAALILCRAHEAALAAAEPSRGKKPH